MDTKTVFAALFLLFVLYVLGVGLGVGGTGPGTDIEQPSWTEALSRFTDRALGPEDVTEASPERCRDQLQEGLFELPAGRDCILTVEESACPICTRTLRLKLLQGAGVTVGFSPADEGMRSQRATLEAVDEEDMEDEDPFIVRFMKGGGTVSLTCSFPETCRIRVVD